jgi:hypothetical protein
MLYISDMARPNILSDATRKVVSLPAELAHAIDNYRFDNRVKTEAKAIRRLIELGLKAAQCEPASS